MMISPAGASDPYAAAAALDRRLRSSDGDSDDASSDSATPDAGPDVVVTLSKDSTSSPSTYDASGRMSGAPAWDDTDADAPDSMSQAGASDGDASVDEDAAIAA